MIEENFHNSLSAFSNVGFTNVSRAFTMFFTKATIK